MSNNFFAGEPLIVPAHFDHKQKNDFLDCAQIINELIDSEDFLEESETVKLPPVDEAVIQALAELCRTEAVGGFKVRYEFDSENDGAWQFTMTCP